MDNKSLIGKHFFNPTYPKPSPELSTSYCYLVNWGSPYFIEEFQPHWTTTVQQYSFQKRWPADSFLAHRHLHDLRHALCEEGTPRWEAHGRTRDIPAWQSTESTDPDPESRGLKIFSWERTCIVKAFHVFSELGLEERAFTFPDCCTFQLYL